MYNYFLDNYLSRLSGSAVKIFIVICRKTSGWHKEEDQISNNQLSNLTGIYSRHTILSAINELIAFDLIQVSRVGSGKATKTVYRVNPNTAKIAPIENANGAKINPLKIAPLDAFNTAKIALINDSNGAKIAPTKEIDINKNKTKKEYIKKESFSPSDFDRFYSAYPLHKSKEAARKSFSRINPSKELLETILRAIELQKQERMNQELIGRDASFWKHPSTWLNQKCWEDEVNLSISENANGFKKTINKTRSDIIAEQSNQRIAELMQSIASKRRDNSQD